MFEPRHVPIRQANRRGLVTLLQTPKLPSGQRSLIERELHEVDALLATIPASESL